MYPITAAILAAIVAGVPKGVNTVAKDAYYGLKTWIATKWQEKHQDEKNKLEKAINDVEDDHSEEAYHLVLSKQVANADIVNDPKALQFVAALKQELQKMGAIGAKFDGVTVKQDFTTEEIVAKGAGSTGLEFTNGEIQGSVHLGKVGATTSPK